MAKKSNRKKKPKIGRPDGATSHRPVGLEVRSTMPLDRAGTSEPRPGLRRVVIETLDEEHAQRLERLASLIKKRDKNLFKYLVPGRGFKKKKAA